MCLTNSDWQAPRDKMVCILNSCRVAWAFRLSIYSVAQAKIYPMVLEMRMHPAAKINDVLKRAIVASSDLGQVLLLLC